MAMTNINTRIFDRELKKGSAELLILSLVAVPGPEFNEREDQGAVGGEGRAAAAALLQIDARREESAEGAAQRVGVLRGRDQSHHRNRACLSGSDSFIIIWPGCGCRPSVRWR